MLLKSTASFLPITALVLDRARSYDKPFGMKINSLRQESSSRRRAGTWLDVFGWLLFCAWVVSCALFESLPRGTGPLGLGILVFAVAFLRKIFGFSISYFWLAIGGVFTLSGIGARSDVDLPFASIALIVCGVLLLLHNRSGRQNR